MSNSAASSLPTSFSARIQRGGGEVQGLFGMLCEGAAALASGSIPDRGVPPGVGSSSPPRWTQLRISGL
jgi:hypothetical protein